MAYEIISISDDDRERHAERAAIKAIRAANYTHCLRVNGIEEFHNYIDDNGNDAIFKGKDIYNKKAWEKYLAQLPYINLGMLVDNVGRLASGYAHWLRSGGYTKRYQALKSAKSRKWVRDNARITAILRIMEHKHENHAFKDAVAERDMDNIQMAKQFAFETNEALGHANKHKELPEQLIEGIHRKYLALLEDKMPIMYQELPALPEGTPDDLIALPDEEENDNE